MTNAIHYANHSVVCDPKVANASYLAEMAESLSATGSAEDHAAELDAMNNDGSWTVVQYYLHVQDLIDAYIGPFPTEQAAQAHYEWCTATRGDSAVLVKISTDAPPAEEFCMTPEEDLAFSAE